MLQHADVSTFVHHYSVGIEADAQAAVRGIVHLQFCDIHEMRGPQGYRSKCTVDTSEFACGQRGGLG